MASIFSSSLPHHFLAKVSGFCESSNIRSDTKQEAKQTGRASSHVPPRVSIHLCLSGSALQLPTAVDSEPARMDQLKRKWFATRLFARSPGLIESVRFSVKLVHTLLHFYRSNCIRWHTNTAAQNNVWPEMKQSESSLSAQIASIQALGQPCSQPARVEAHFCLTNFVSTNPIGASRGGPDESEMSMRLARVRAPSHRSISVHLSCVESSRVENCCRPQAKQLLACHLGARSTGLARSPLSFR